MACGNKSLVRTCNGNAHDASTAHSTSSIEPSCMNTTTTMNTNAHINISYNMNMTITINMLFVCCSSLPCPAGHLLCGPKLPTAVCTLCTEFRAQETDSKVTPP